MFDWESVIPSGCLSVLCHSCTLRRHSSSLHTESEQGIMEYDAELSALSLLKEDEVESQVVESVILGLESCGGG